MCIRDSRMGWGAEEEKKNQNTIIFDFGNLDPEERMLLREQLIQKIENKNNPKADIIDGQILDENQEDNAEYVFVDEEETSDE